MKNKLTIFSFIALLAMISFACKKDKTTTTTPDTNIGLKNNGSFIKGTIITSTAANVSTTFTFEHDYVDWDLYVTGAGTYGNYMYKDFIGWNNGYDESRIRITIDSLADQVLNAAAMNINATTKLSNGDIFAFSLSGAQVPTVSNYKYDPLTKSITGDFSLNTTSTGNGKSAIISGSFKIANGQNRVVRQAAQ